MIPFMVALEPGVGKQFPAGLMDNCEMDNFPLTLTLSLRGRGAFRIFVLIVCNVLFGAVSASAETWQCKQPDGTVIFSDRNLTGQCAPMEEGPPLLRVPSVAPVPAADSNPDSPTPVPPEPAQVPTPGRGRRIDPPSDAFIT